MILQLCHFHYIPGTRLGRDRIKCSDGNIDVLFQLSFFLKAAVFSNSKSVKIFLTRTKCLLSTTRQWIGRFATTQKVVSRLAGWHWTSEVLRDHRFLSTWRPALHGDLDAVVAKSFHLTQTIPLRESCHTRRFVFRSPSFSGRSRVPYLIAQAKDCFPVD